MSDNIFDFEEMKKKIEKMAEDQKKYEEAQAKQGNSQPDMSKIFEAYAALGSLFKPPSEEQMKKATTDFAEALEAAAKSLRSMYGDEKEEEGTEDDS